MPWQNLQIDLTGEVLPCCYWNAYGNQGGPLGNTNTQTIEEIWNGPAYRELRRRNASGELDNHPCGNCMSQRATGQFPPYTWSSQITPERGYAYKTERISETVIATLKENETVALYEDGTKIGRGESLHDDIRAEGLGRFSLWNGTLYFSTSDNSDPRRNGRQYELRCGSARSRIGGLALNSRSGENITRAFEEYEAGSEVMTAKPTMLTLVSTSDCNIDCPSCSQNMVREMRVQHRAETVPSVLELVPYMAQFTWQGGEPYLIKRFRRFIDEFRHEDNPNLTFGFTSNGTMLTAAEVEKLKKFPQLNASVSIDSFIKESFEKIRAGAAFDRVIGNLTRAVSLYDSSRWVIVSGMIMIKSNMVEIAENLRRAIAYDIGLNLSPVMAYPVTERLDAYEDFATQTVGWEAALDEAEAVVQAAKEAGRPAIKRVNPEGMVRELKAIYQTQKRRYADTIDIDVNVSDPTDALLTMRRPGLLVCEESRTDHVLAYLSFNQGAGKYRLRIPRTEVNESTPLIWYVTHNLVDLFASTEISSVGQFDLLHHITRKGPQRAPWRKRFGKLTLDIVIPPYAHYPIEKNIAYAAYGETTPEGLVVPNEKEVFIEYQKRIKEETRGFHLGPAALPLQLQARRNTAKLIKLLRKYVSSG